MSGRRPDTTQVWNFISNYREAGGKPHENRTAAWNDLPQWFKRSGFWTTGMGKTYHNGVGHNTKGFVSDDWSDLDRFPYMWDASNNTFKMFDINNTDATIVRIQYAAAQFQSAPAKPFFITQGYMKPHLPWFYPADILDQHYPTYQNGSQVVPPAANPNWPTGTTPIAWHQGWENVATNFAEPFPDATVSALRLKYFACISFVDREVGRLLDALEASGVSNSTAVVFLGDHGWQLYVTDALRRCPPALPAGWVLGVLAHLTVRVQGGAQHVVEDVRVRSGNPHPSARSCAVDAALARAAIQRPGGGS